MYDNDTGEEIANMQFPKKIWHIVNDPAFHCMFWLGIHCDPNPMAEEYPQKQMRCSTSFIVSSLKDHVFLIGDFPDQQALGEAARSSAGQYKTGEHFVQHAELPVSCQAAESLRIPKSETQPWRQYI